ncbi:MAG: single-stranded DNA-binding protein [Pseudomonas sp.]|nr:single-stranded DNA-binding protein [Pseudomonas sp.]|tara:strand:+ start:635 stop:1534 length:900 start_codon:yes stop_codon:yes gene_type:complete
MSSSLDKLRAAMESASPSEGAKKSYQDDTMWKPELDKTGNGYAVIRFLPTPEGEEMPWVSYFDHGFQGPGGWYIEKSLTTLNKKDPVSEYNTSLWNTGIEANKEIARKQKRRLHYVSNVYVVSDPKNPDNEGKVFKYRYGKKIFEALKEAISPAFEDENAINPFDLRGEGANFKIKIRKVDGYWNYDKSEFDSVAPLFDNEEQINQVFSQVHSLSAVIAPEEFKSYEELKEKLERVLGTVGSTSTAESVAEDLEEVPWSNVNTASTASEPVIESAEVSAGVSASSEDDAMDYFKKLAQD